MSENRHSLMIHSVKDFEIQLNDQDYELLKRTILPELQEELELARSIQDEVIKQNETLTKQLVELQSDKVELIAQRDTWIGKANALRAQHIAEMNAKVEALEWRDKEICALRAELEEVKTMMDYTFRQNIEFQLQLDIAVEATKALLYVAEMRRNWDILSSDDFDEAYPDECGWAFGDVDENMIQKMEMAQKALAEIEKGGKNE